jgi:putative inorganic carbon (HCO3(-)) transporter
MASVLSGWRLTLPVVLISAPLAFAAAWNPVVALIGLGTVLVLAAVVARAEALVLVLVAALPWEDTLAYPTQTITVVKLLGLLLFAAWLVRALVRNDRLELPRTLAPVALLGLAVGVSYLLSPEPATGVSKLLRYALFIVFFFLLIQLTEDRPQVVRILRVICASATGAAGWALYQFAFDPTSQRAGGPIGDPNDFAYFIACTLPLVGYLIARDRGAARVAWATGFVLLAGTLLATLSRGALVGVAALALWGILSRRLPFVGVAAGVAAIVGLAVLALTLWAPLFEERLERKENFAAKNVSSRQATWTAAALMAADRPWTGVGPDRFGTEGAEYVRNNPIASEYPVVHNSYLEILAEHGIVAMLAFVAFLTGTWRLLGQARIAALATRDADGARLTTAMQAALVPAIVSAAFLSEQLTTPFWLLGALATVVARPSVSRASPPRHLD